MSFRKCGTCIHFYVKPNEIEIAQHAPDISACQPGMPHCLGGQVRGGCGRWEERAQMGMPMPWGNGPMVENTFGCKLWQRGGPSVKQIGSFNVAGAEKAPMLGGLASPLAVIAGIIAAGAVKNFMSKKEDDYGYEEDVIFEQDDDFYYE